MRWLTRWHRTPTPPLTTETLVTQALTPLAPQLAALTALLPQAIVAQTLLPILHRLVAFCWDLPASAAHHHSRPFGLLTHSLEVAQHALRAFSQSSLWWATVPDPAQRHRTEGHWRLGTALAGLLHDGGKVFDVTVTLPAVPAWNPLQEPLLAWLLTHQVHGTLPTPTVTWQPGRGMRHQTLGALAAALLLTPEDLVHLTLPVARELWAFLGGRSRSGQPLSPAPGPPGGTRVADGTLRQPMASRCAPIWPRSPRPSGPWRRRCWPRWRSAARRACCG